MKQSTTIAKFCAVLALVLFLLPGSVMAQDKQAQSDSNAESQTEITTSNVSIRQTLEVSATVDLNVNGQIYSLKLPATIDIDTTSLLADSNRSINQENKVGVLAWNIVGISDEGKRFEYGDYSKAEVSNADLNTLIVVVSEITNLDSQPMEFSYGFGDDVLGYDEVGNTYEESDRDCQTIDPNETARCLIIFDVPQGTSIIGLDLKVKDHKRISFTQE